jgi:HAE1 family hydrophobic/amphiphilic exporter-1
MRTDRAVSSDEMARTMMALAPGVAPQARVVAIPATAVGGGVGQPIDMTVTTSQGEPDAYAAQVLGALQQTPGARYARSSSLQSSPQVDVQIDRDRARALDLDVATAAAGVRATFGGRLATQFEDVTGTKYVQVLYPQREQSSLAALREVGLRTRAGRVVRLGDVALFSNTLAQALITRVNRETVVHVSANVIPGSSLSGVERGFMQRVSALHLPGTVTVAPAAGGQQQSLSASVNGIAAAFALSLLLVYLLMVALYDGYRAPLVIMLTVPVAGIGAVAALALTQQTLNLFSMIGVIMLIGLVSKNGILLVDFAQQKVRAGMEKRRAILQAASERFRPIIMTTASMIAGMLPLACALDPGLASRRSLGTVVIGGLTSSLLLTLVLIPVAYLWIAPGPPVEAAQG